MDGKFDADKHKFVYDLGDELVINFDLGNFGYILERNYSGAFVAYLYQSVLVPHDYRMSRAFYNDDEFF